MPRWTLDEYTQFLQRGMVPPEAPTGQLPLPDGPESTLHDFILEQVQVNGWIAFHGSMAHRTHRTVGEPDFVILMAGGQLLLVEAKTAQGKLSPDQLALAAHARKLGHQIHVVRSQKEFSQLIKPHENQSQERLSPSP